MSRKTIGVFASMTVIIAAVVGFGGAVLASHTFNDTSGTPFETEIDNIAHAGCATGFPSGDFKPTSAVSRQQFSGWLNRCGGRVAFDGPNQVSNLVDNDALADVSITVGGAGSDVTQMILLEGTSSIFTNSTFATYNQGGVSNAVLEIWDTDTNTNLTSTWAFVRFTDNSQGSDLSVQVVVEADKGVHNYELRYGESGIADSTMFGFGSSLSATVFPFGPDGTNSLSGTPGAAPGARAGAEPAPDNPIFG
ncbi:MAG: S-layer homology domain-containing protein [Acidimicrobiales bacterium]